MSPRVLCVEDDPSNRRLLESLFARRPGVELVMASSGAEAVAATSEHEPVLVLCDLNLPDFDGDEVLRRLRSQPSTCAVPVVMLSADATEQTRQRLLRAGAAHYVTKPFDLEEFYEVLDRFTA